MPVSSEDIANSIAQQFDLSVDHFIASGCDGDVWRLNNGLIVKITSSVEEAAAALAIQQAQHSGQLMPDSIVNIHYVCAIEPRIEVGLYQGLQKVWAILRADVDPEPMKNLGENWADLLVDLNLSVIPGQNSASLNPIRVQEIYSSAQALGFGEPFQQVIAAWQWLDTNLGIGLIDIQSANFGVIHGVVAPLDYGNCMIAKEWRAQAELLAPMVIEPVCMLSR